jgi:hypothetical protein
MSKEEKSKFVLDMLAESVRFTFESLRDINGHGDVVASLALIGLCSSVIATEISELSRIIMVEGITPSDNDGIN